MKRALIRIRNASETDRHLADMGKAFVAAWHSGQMSDPVATFTFSSPAQLFTVISPKRWELIEQLQKLGPSSIRGLARAIGRDVKRVHDDVVLLAEWGIVERRDNGKVCVPYEVIHADFDLRAAA